MHFVRMCASMCTSLCLHMICFLGDAHATCEHEQSSNQRRQRGSARHTNPVDCFQYSYINGCKDGGSICWEISEIVPRSVAVELVMFKASIRRGSAIIACPSYAKRHSRPPRQPVNAREWKAKNRPASPSFPPSNSSPQIRPAPASVTPAEVAAEMEIEGANPGAAHPHSTVGSLGRCFPLQRGRGEHGGGQAHTTHQPRSHLAFPNRKADVISRTQVP